MVINPNKIQNKVEIDVESINICLRRYVKLFDKDQKFYQLSSDGFSLELFHPELLVGHTFQLINYRWTRELEKINNSPRISKKVIDGYREDIKRTSGLYKKFGRFIEIENPQKKCFITGEIIQDGDLSIDHVIPWSYIYSDDLWNLVFVSKSEKTHQKVIEYQQRQ